MRRWPIILLLLSGCGDDDGVKPTPMAEPEVAMPSQEEPAAKAEFLPPQTQARQDQLRAWSACLRRTEPRVRKSWGRYRAAINPETGKLARRTEVAPFVHRVELDMTPCRSLPDPTADAEASPSHLQDAVTRYVAAVEAFAVLAEQLAPYYDDKGYKDDGWARSQELAPKFSATFATFETATGELRPLLREARNDADDEALEILRDADAPTAAGLAIAVGRDARAVRACFEVDPPDPTSCEAALAALKASYGLVAEAVENPPQTQYVFWLDALERTSERLVNRTREALNAMQPGKGRRRPTYSDADRDEVFVACAHVEDVADNVRFGL